MHFSSLGSSQALPYTICDLSLNLRIDSSLDHKQGQRFLLVYKGQKEYVCVYVLIELL